MEIPTLIQNVIGELLDKPFYMAFQKYDEYLFKVVLNEPKLIDEFINWLILADGEYESRILEEKLLNYK